ncbi:Amino acid transporter transmembrane domain [Trinorchestia longiramus]|nr:Amino acid transporter transmembrane domain [Trinorchestia longiramus]
MDERQPLLQSTHRRKSSLFRHIDRPGMDVVTAVCYILALIGVMPIIALPAAISRSGYAGVGTAVVLLILICSTAMDLGECWVLAETFYPNIIGHGSSRQPYPLLGEVIGGLKLRRLLTLMQDISLMGAAMPFLLLASESVQEVVAVVTSGTVDFSFCYWLLVLTLLLLPLVWLGAPADLKVVAWVGAGLVVGVAVAVMTALALDLSSSGGHRPPLQWPRWRALAYCYGAVAFQFDIHPVLLSVQSDMQNGRRMRVAVAAAFVCAGLLYTPVVGLAWVRWGSDVSHNLLNSLPSSPLLYGIMAAIVGQVLICLCLSTNTLFQDVEEWLGLPDAFGWRRVLCRTGLMLTLLFLCETLPHLGVVIELVGGLLLTPFIFILPPIFNIILKARCLGITSTKDLVVGGVTVAVGVLGCMSSTWESIQQLLQHHTVPLPCYLDVVAATDAEELEDLSR